MSEVLFQQLRNYAADANGKFTVLRKGEVTVEIDQKNVKGFISRLVNDLRVRHLSTMTGLDLGQNIGIIYHFSRDKEMIDVKTFVPKTQPTAVSIVDIVPGAILYEMEIHDMFGANFEGNPWMDRKLLLPDTWPADLPPPLLKSSKPNEIRKRLHLEVEGK
ncbi:MAG: NADH-quinone oxidoreductase subunit C [Candidatus Bathyarchaeia archaeon]|jgi:NADH:ubiquinone oxidoreductase subunit C